MTTRPVPYTNAPDASRAEQQHKTDHGPSKKRAVDAPLEIVLSHDELRVVVTNYGGNNVGHLDLSTGKVFFQYHV